MSSLRTRLLVVVLLLATAGLVALAAVTYAEQSAFLQKRVNQEVESAAPVIAAALQGEEQTEGKGANGDGNRMHGPPDDNGGPAAPAASLPPAGTVGQRRTESGKLVISRRFDYDQSGQPDPKIPAKTPIEKLFTVGSRGSSGLRYRVYVTNDADDHEVTVAAVPLSEVDDTLDHLLLVEGLVIAGVLIALGISAYFVVRLGLRPLDRIEVTAGEIAGGELSRRVSPASTRSEVGRLGIALNAMLDRLERAFKEREASEERLRRFIADASHELRTPLASIRGYAELYRMGATRGEEGTRTAMQRIESESRRMGTLVEDLLTLARLDEQRTPSRERVDVAALARDVVSDARVTASDRRIELDAADAASVLGDSHQLHQVLANLMRNALVHTPAGSPIEVRVARAGETVVLSVRDHGPGLPAAARASIFDRFWRAEGGRVRGRAGAGLGLAIVREIVDAHGGQIAAENAPDGGALFTVRLPQARQSRAAPEGGER